jgi:hypothetical protein
MEILMRSIAERRFPIMLIILFALLGIAVSVAIGRVIAAQTGQTTPRSSMEEDRMTDCNNQLQFA